MPPDTIEALLRDGRRLLVKAGINSAALDARLLLQHATGLRHEDVIAKPAQPVKDETATTFRAMIARRLAHEPVSRIIGSREFYGREFAISPAVLDPRPDTETLIDAALSLLPAGKQASILDLGTGSGAIIVTLLAERPQTRGVATDISPATLVITAANAAQHGVNGRLTLIATDWWKGVSGRFDLIVSNPPYIPRATIADLAPEVRNFDPLEALDGGEDGCDAYRRIAGGAGPHLVTDGWVLVEIGENQRDAVTTIFSNSGLALNRQSQDLAGRVRCLVFGPRQNRGWKQVQERLPSGWY